MLQDALIYSDLVVGFYLSETIVGNTDWSSSGFSENVVCWCSTVWILWRCYI